MKKIRMLDWLLVSLLLAGAIWLLAPHQLGVTLYKLSLVSLAAVAGYWIDRSLFPYARPDQVGCNHLNAAMLRRAVVIAACVVGVSLGA
jgi:hypothetical protein